MIPLLIWKSFGSLYGIFFFFLNYKKNSKAQDPKPLQAKRQIPWTMQPAPCQLAWLCFFVWHCENSCTTTHESPRVKSMWPSDRPRVPGSDTPHALSPHSPQRNVPLRRTQSDGPHPIEETVHGWNGFRVSSDGLEASRASCNQTLVCSPPPFLVFWTKPLPTTLFPFIAFAVAPSVCVSAFLFAGEPRFGCIFGQQLTSAVALSNTGHFFFLYRFLKVKILKERPKPSWK